MSFKLVDNKSSAEIRLHKKRRSDELMRDFIPSTDYIVNRSGKLCCKICPQWPVFDTLSMLQSHREGKKHTFNKEELDKATMRQFLKQQSEEPSCSHSETRSSPVSGPSYASRETYPIGFSTSANHRYNESIPSAKRKRWTPFFQTNTQTKMILQKQKIGMVKDLDGKLIDIEMKMNRGSYNANNKKKASAGNAYARSAKSIFNFEDAKTDEVALDRTGGTDLKMKYYAKMKQNGWIIDSNEKWIRDQDCEFDSDEDPPKFQEFEKWNK